MAELVRGVVTDRPWGRTLATVGLRSMSGQLTVHADGREFSIVFSQGAVVGAFSPLPADSVARVALTAGLLTANEVTEVARRQSHDDGTDVVVEVGRLTPDQTARLRRRATAHRAARTFALERGEFILTDTVTAGWHPDAAVDVRAVIYLGARLTLSEQRLASDLGLLGASFRLRDDAIPDLPQFGLSELERPVLAALRQGASLLAAEQACAELDQRTVRAVIYSLVCGGAVDAIGELQQPGGPAMPRTRTGNQSAPAGSTVMQPPRTTTPGQQLPTQPPPMARTATSPIPARTTTPGQQLPTQPPVQQRAPSGPIPAMPVQARTATGTSRPVSGSQPPMGPRTTTPSSQPPQLPRTSTPLPARAGSTTQPPGQAPLPRTHTPLDPPRTTTPPPPRITTPPSRGNSTSPSNTYGKADVRVPTATGTAAKNPLAVSELQSLIKAKVSLVDQGADHFLLLGVKPDAPAEVIRTAFYGLVRRLHPDLLVAVGLPVTDEAQRLMAQLNEAYAVLNTPERRREYELRLATGLSAPTDERAAAAIATALNAEEHYRRGQAALKRDDLEEAVRELEAAVEIKKDEGDYLAVLTWARFCLAPDKEAAAPAARQALDRAARLSPESVTPRFWHGRLERTLGRSQQALAHFRWVLDEDPRHAEAAAEVRLLMSRDSGRKR